MMNLTDHIRSQHRDLLAMVGERVTLVRDGHRTEFLAVEDRDSGSWFKAEEPLLRNGDEVRLTWPGPSWRVPGGKYEVKAVQHNGVTGQEFLLHCTSWGW